MIHTLIQIAVFQFLFLAVYDLFLKKETFFSVNRAYLLLTPILGFVLPFVNLGFIQQTIPQEFRVQLPAAILGNTASETGNSQIFSFSTIENLWIIGVIVSVSLFSYKIFKLKKLNTSGTTEISGRTRLIILPETDLAFSFFNTIYLGVNISETKRTNIISHEKVHIEQKHSFDLLYFELLRIVFWFNPLVYIFQNRISTLHEYIADAAIARQKGKKQYYQNLLSEVFQTSDISFVNTFFKQSLIKKRIIMLQKIRSGKTAQLKYLLLLPIICGMLVYSACSDIPKIEETSIQESEAEILNKIKEQEEAKIKEYKTSDKNKAIIENGAISDVPYSVIEQAPKYPGCSGDAETMRACMSMKIAEFVNGNFNVGIADDLKLSGRQRIAVQFKIDKTGKVADIRARASVPELEMEAVRVIEMLPEMIPGEHEGEKVGVLYSLPIIFQVALP